MAVAIGASTRAERSVTQSVERAMIRKEPTRPAECPRWVTPTKPAQSQIGKVVEGHRRPHPKERVEARICGAGWIRDSQVPSWQGKHTPATYACPAARGPTSTPRSLNRHHPSLPPAHGCGATRWLAFGRSAAWVPHRRLSRATRTTGTRARASDPRSRPGLRPGQQQESVAPISSAQPVIPSELETAISIVPLLLARDLMSAHPELLYARLVPASPPAGLPALPLGWAPVSSQSASPRLATDRPTPCPSTRHGEKAPWSVVTVGAQPQHHCTLPGPWNVVQVSCFDIPLTTARPPTLDGADLREDLRSSSTLHPGKALASLGPRVRGQRGHAPPRACFVRPSRASLDGLERIVDR
ncbi:uncharacterized protein PSFLO_04425 [Pseudozyma flocculosa]|uniref:Uncharacterized protein n=1 Tax=Pseudozyma flocculosa TaxID=84751 RepID=A0A5C3F4Q8_9BASI|nr:uncharacterized protein PSFLO_04425 [Pseudozyma flocculosa]